jgi:hypothetical protein
VTSRRLLLLAACVFTLTAQTAKTAAKPQFDIRIPAFRDIKPVFFAIAGQEGRPGIDAWTVAIPSAEQLTAAEKFYLDQLKSQGFTLTGTTQNKGGTHHKLLNKERAIQANLSAGGKIDKPKIAIAISWFR